MTTVVLHHNHERLPQATDDIIPVVMYNRRNAQRDDLAAIGQPVLDKLKRLGVAIDPVAMDFLSIALAITAADTFVLRKHAVDGWVREITLRIPLNEPERWLAVQPKLEKVLHFLSGDIWRIEIEADGFPPAAPYGLRHKLISLQGRNCVCLFSGGLDSAVGAIDLLATNRSPLLVSQAYNKDNSKQKAIAQSLGGSYSRFSANVHPLSADGKTEVSMRTRSINFLAFATIGCSVVRAANNLERVDLFVPENGFISLNAPLTTRRIGSLSTRTTHPYFLSIMQEIFNDVGMRVNIINPYQFLTKGEMIHNCRNQDALQTVVSDTVSCSHWKRQNQQCGRCVPCIIRRAAIKRGNMQEPDFYQFQRLSEVLQYDEFKDDLFAVMNAIQQRNLRPIGSWIVNSGPIPPEDFDAYKSIFVRGLNEVEQLLIEERVL